MATMKVGQKVERLVALKVPTTAVVLVECLVEEKVEPSVAMMEGLKAVKSEILSVGQMAERLAVMLAMMTAAPMVAR